MSDRDDETGEDGTGPGLLDRIVAAARRGLDPKGGWIRPGDPGKENRTDDGNHRGSDDGNAED